MPIKYNWCPRVGELRKAIKKIHLESYKYPEPIRTKLFKPQLDPLRAELKTYHFSKKRCKGNVT